MNTVGQLLLFERFHKFFAASRVETIMDLRICLLVAALISLSAATDLTERNSSDEVENRGN